MQNKFNVRINKRVFLKEPQKFLISDRSKIMNVSGRKRFVLDKRAGTPIDITLLVFMALALAGGTLLIFYLHGGYVSSRISDSRFLEETYVKEGKIDFYVNEMMTRAILKINDKSNPVPDFTRNFKIELEKYKINGTYVLSELVQLENVSNENVGFVDGKIIFSMNINLQQSFEEKFSVNYNFNKKFEKEI